MIEEFDSQRSRILQVMRIDWRNALPVFALPQVAIDRASALINEKPPILGQQLVDEWPCRDHLFVEDTAKKALRPHEHAERIDHPMACRRDEDQMVDLRSTAT